MKKILIRFVPLLLVTTPVFGAAKHRPAPAPPAPGKRVLQIMPVGEVAIELPDQSRYSFGEAFQAALLQRLGDSGKFVITQNQSPSRAAELNTDAGDAGDTIYLPGSSEPAAVLKISVDALSFVTGSRGDRMFYGFDERLPTSFPVNEFPLKAFDPSNPSWFGSVFANKGSAPLDSRAGLDLGEGLSFDVLFAWLGVKYAKYQSELMLTLDVSSPLSGRHEIKTVKVRGGGYFFDVVAGYEGYSAGIQIARRDAMLQALQNALPSAVGVLEESVGMLPLTGVIDAIFVQNGRTLYSLGTGIGSQIPVGTRYQVVGSPGLVFTATQSESRGTVGELTLGDPAQVQIGMRLVEPSGASPTLTRAALTAEGAPAPAIQLSPTEVQLPANILPQSELNSVQAPKISRFSAFLRSLAELVFLPYRIWRYENYDQAYHREADAPYEAVDVASLRQTAWAKQIGLDLLSDAEGAGQGVSVAILDTGVDYNHPFLHDSLWMNPQAQTDADQRVDHYGWDFISADSRPFDDAYHGTQLASLVHTVAPEAKILPLKVFNPWGVTSSAAMHSAFVYAVDHGAQIILCGWATAQHSAALRQGVEYAQSHDVVVVTAAGDEGADISTRPFYPAAFSGDFAHLIAVAAVDSADALLNRDDRPSNSGSRLVQIAAPGADLRVAEPRAGWGTDRGTGLASALVAGALARIVSHAPTSEHAADWIRTLREDSEVLDGLKDQVSGGLRLRVR